MSQTRAAVIAILVSLLPSVGLTQIHKETQPSVPVAPVDEITVIDPRTSPDGKPHPIVTGGPGHQQVDIPPTVIVHNYYYTGDRDFRGPSFMGGPAIIVVTHPHTAEQMYLDVNMLAGSPRVIYRRNYIEYDFGHQKIQLRFTHPLHVFHRHEPSVKYSRGNPRRLKPTTVPVKRVGAWIERTGVPHAVSHVAHGAASVAHATADGIHTAGRIVSTPLIRIGQATPLGALIDRTPEELEQSARDRAVQRAADERLRQEASIPTLR